MGFAEGNKSVLTFNVLLESVNPASLDSFIALLNTVNERPWMDKEPESCMVIGFKQARPVTRGNTAVMDHAEFTVSVGYRPPGWISGIRDDGRQRLNSWRLEARNQTNDGVLLDLDGKPLANGLEPIYLSFAVYEPIDYNKFEFGEFLGES